MSLTTLKFLTYKLRSQTLDEHIDSQEQNRDSGAESDDENNAHLPFIKTMDHVESVRLSVDDSFADLSPSFGFSSESSTLVLVKSFCDSPSPDSALASDNDRNHDQHSSEEELEVINRDAPSTTCQSSASSSSAFHPEKRKWSQANRLSFGGDSSASSDDEVRELMCCSAAPLQFCTSPPADAHKPSQSASPPAKLFHFATSLSPRKKHRQQTTTPPTSTSNTTTPTPRPCLDFEKMQQLRTRAVSAWRPSREVSLIC